MGRATSNRPATETAYCGCAAGVEALLGRIVSIINLQASHSRVEPGWPLVLAALLHKGQIRFVVSICINISDCESSDPDALAQIKHSVINPVCFGAVSTWGSSFKRTDYHTGTGALQG